MDWIHAYIEINPIRVYFGNDSYVKATATGYVQVEMQVPNGNYYTQFQRILYVPSLKRLCL